MSSSVKDVVLAGIVVLLLVAYQACAAERENSMILSCKEDNDLYLTLQENKIACNRYDTPGEAVDHAGEGSGVLILADGYPQQTTVIEPAVFEEAAGKQLRLYVEYPSFLPGVEIGAPRGTHWERAVIASDAFAPAVRKLRILAMHDCSFVPMKSDHPLIVMARVAGFDTAVYGLPAETFPILFEMPETTNAGEVLVSTAKLSQFITARFAPTDAWTSIWKYVFAWLEPNAEMPELKWTPKVRPSFGPDEALPSDIERQALKRGIDWYFNSRMVMHPSMMAKYNKPANAPVAEGATEDWPYGHRVARMPDLSTPVGDGSLGVLEGFEAKIFHDGTQPVRWWKRNDCNGEIAGAMCVAGVALNNPTYRNVGGNVGDWLCFKSMISLGDRADPKHPAYGLMGWNDVPLYCGPDWPGRQDGYEVYYMDDNARAGLGMILAAAVLKTDRYDERLSKNLLALLRVTGKNGARPERIDQSTLEERGWQSFFNDTRESHRNDTTGMATVWAYFLWAYNQTGFDLFLEQTRTPIGEAMKRFPGGHTWRGVHTRTWMLLPLAWLVRVDDTPEHRKWLRDVAESLNQVPSGAIRDELRRGAWAAPPKSNEEYGSTEAVLLQSNDDAVSDLLYTVNMAFIGLHEAAMATGEAYYKEAEDKLAEFLCRAQVRSERHPELDGAWFRAFDIKKWEYWASNTDAGWGAWCIESGWSQSWYTIALALRQMDTSLWDIAKDSNIEKPFGDLRKQMLPDEILK